MRQSSDGCLERTSDVPQLPRAQVLKYRRMAEAEEQRIRETTDHYLAAMTVVHAMQDIFSKPPVPRGFINIAKEAKRA